MSSTKYGVWIDDGPEQYWQTRTEASLTDARKIADKCHEKYAADGVAIYEIVDGQAVGWPVEILHSRSLSWQRLNFNTSTPTP